MNTNHTNHTISLAFSLIIAGICACAVSAEEYAPALKIHMGVRLQFDGVRTDASQPRNSENFEYEIRRARTSLKVRYQNDWRLRVELDVSDLEQPETRSLWVAYHGFHHTRVRLGNQLPAYGLEESTSSDNLAFMERSLQHVFAPDHAPGISLHYYNDLPWTFAFGYYRDKGSNKATDPRFATSRLTYARELNHHSLVHLGLSSVYTFSPEGDLSIRYRPRPESHVIPRGMIKSRRMRDVDNTLLTDLELAYVHGPVKLQSEITRVAVKRASRDNLFHGWYLSGSWLITGESHNYDARYGRFRGIKPESHYGAVELSARYSNLDLDRGLKSVSESNTTLGLNWHLRNRSKLSINWVTARIAPTKQKNQHDQWLQFRFQMRF